MDRRAVGFLWNKDRVYVHGFASLAVPMDNGDVTLLFKDVGIGYWLYRCKENRFITSIAPTLEAHITTPLNHRGAMDPIIVPDLIVLTGGLHFGLSGRSTLTLGVATPVTGPQPMRLKRWPSSTGDFERRWQKGESGQDPGLRSLVAFFCCPTPPSQ